MTLIFALYALVTGGVLYGAWLVVFADPNGTWTDYAKVAGVGLTATTSLCAAAIGALTARRQRRSQIELERLTGSLGYVRDAFRIIRRAANRYYYALSRLEAGTFDADAVAKAEAAMERAAADSVELAPGDRPLWDQFWQSGRLIGESAAALGPTATAADRRKLWLQHATRFGDLRTRLIAAADPKNPPG